MSFVPQFCLFTTNLASDSETYLPGTISSRQFSIGSIGGFLDAGFTHQASESHLWDWINHLGKRGAFYNSYADKCWEGYVHSVSIKLGAVTITYSLDKLINRSMVTYTPFDGQGNSGNAAQETATAWVEDLVSQAKYGIREVVQNGGELNDSAALNMLNAFIQLYSRPYPTRQVSIGKSSNSEVAADVQLRGYWATTAWQIYNNETDTEVSTDTQIKTILTNECPFISTDYSNVAASGLDTWQYRYENMTAQDEILRLMALGYGTGAPPPRLVGGVYEDRKFHLSVADTTSVKYRCGRNGRFINDRYGQLVMPWDVRPNAVLEIEDLEPSGINYPTELDDQRRLYIERVQYSEPDSVAITPFGQEDLGTIISSLGLRWSGA